MTRYIHILSNTREHLARNAAVFRARRDMHGEKLVLAELRKVTLDCLAWDAAAMGRQGDVLRLVGPGVSRAD